MKPADFSETAAVIDLKVGRSRHLIEFMKVCSSIEGKGNFLTLAQGREQTKNQTRFSQKLLGRSKPFCMKAFMYMELTIG